MQEKDLMNNVTQQPLEDVSIDNSACACHCGVCSCQGSCACDDHSDCNCACDNQCDGECACSDDDACVDCKDDCACEQPPKQTFLKRVGSWLVNHKPSTRRLVQVYAGLLYNCYIKGYIKGEIFTGMSKVICTPGLNCYSCPGAVGACPLGSLQNALAGSKTKAPYYVIGILMLYGLMLGRTICGWLCPVGLAQDLLYKIKTPKAPKSKISRVLSYFKYVLLAILVIGVPLIYALDQTAVPGFCKYICPAGTFGGAVMLLINPSNANMYQMLGPLFTWKMIVLAIVIVGCIFIYRMFCRYLCPLGAFYSLFNRFSILGVKLDQSKCIDCGKCVTACKLDIKKVGDHECINCGECIGVCPTKAITWKGGKVFLNGVQAPSINKDESVQNDAQSTQSAVENVKTTQQNAISVVNDNVDAPSKLLDKDAISSKKARQKSLALRIVCIVLMVALFVGVACYANLYTPPSQIAGANYTLAISHTSASSTGLLSFSIGDSTNYVNIEGGSGTQQDPYVLSSPVGRYDIPINQAGQTVYATFTTTKDLACALTANASVHLRVYYNLVGKQYLAYDSASFDTNIISFSLEKPQGYGNTVGAMCYDFTLAGYNGVEQVTLSNYVGKVVVINFWATWCGGCVDELPYFEQLYTQFGDSMQVIAIHSANITTAVQPFMNDKGWDTWSTLFAQDTGDNFTSDYFKLLGGKDSYPRTFVLDQDGVIRYVFEGSVTYNMISNAISNLLVSE